MTETNENSIESIDRQIKELQVQRSRMIEEQSKHKEFYNIDNILISANQRLREVLIESGVEEHNVLSFVSNQTGLREECEMMRIGVMTSENRIILDRVLSVCYIHKVIDEITAHAIALEEISRKFSHAMIDTDGMSRNAIHLKTLFNHLDVYVILAEDDKFNVSSNQSFDSDDKEVYIRLSDHSNSRIRVGGLDLSVEFEYKRENVSVSDIADILIEIDSDFSKSVIDD